ncbi:MAG: transcriptional regulator, GntR family [Microbacteriaceae bacterium]|nr:transcriptional regulator, GntR family [Microbacteriaceae bacterium]
MGDQLSIQQRPESLSDQVFGTIREAIISRTLAPGSAVTEAQLAKDLGVSKTPVREALLRLREVGLVQSMPIRGMTIIESSREALIQAYELRGILESAVAKLAAIKASEDEINELTAVAKKSLQFAKKHDAANFRLTDRQFHSAVWASAGNPELERIAENAYLLSSALRAIHALSSSDSIKCAQQHVDIASAIGDRDATRAAEFAANHVRDVLQYSLPSA